MALLAVVYVLWARPTFLWATPPLWIPAAAILALAVGSRRVPLAVAAWWLLGLLSLTWSFTPGATFVATLWTLTYVAVWVVTGRAAFVLALLWVVLAGMVSGLSLQVFGMVQYFSGSIAYLTGAAALALLPWAFWLGTLSSRLPIRLGAWSVAAVAAYAALASGSRAVYLGLGVVAVLVLARLLAATPHRLGRTMLTLLIVVVVVAAANEVVPGRPVTSAMGLKARASVAALSSPGVVAGQGSRGTSATAQYGPPGDENAIASRLKMWDQTARIGLTHPLGTGLGSFRDTISAFQIYPSVNFASAHNALLEVFATEGWPGLLLLLFILGSSIWRGWRSRERWPFAVGAAGLWLTMCFDITWSMPVMPLLGFWALGVAHDGRPEEESGASRTRSWRRARVAGSLAAVVTATVLVGWWYWPCGGAQWALGRHLGYRQEVAPIVAAASPAARSEILTRLDRLYPKSLWVRSLARQVAASPRERIEADQAIVREFPLASPLTYLELARLLGDSGQVAEARRVLDQGLQRFPPTLSPAGVPLVSRSAEYGRWISEAHALQAKLGR